VVSYFVGGNRIPELGGVKKEEERRNLLEAMRFPLRVTWQPLQYRALSDRTFNISAACNVLPFSGWENEKFSSNLLQRRCGNDFFGLRVQGMNVTGCLPSTIEEELKRQWDCFEAIEPELPKIHFEGKLKLVKESDWYKHDIEAKGGMSDVSTIAKFAEEDALALFLAFSSLCLKVASSSEAKESSFRYKQLALSVLLPLVSEFRFATTTRTHPCMNTLSHFVGVYPLLFLCSVAFALTKHFGLLLHQTRV
jgi:hypothetical protein